MSVRVGGDAALRIGLAGGADTTLHAGQALDALDTGRVCWLEVSAASND